ncbi:MAG: radical SAM family heme chaperone HemW [Gammaproteobacteria bacterium]
MMDAPGLYVHLPWCTRKCPYCDFNSHRSPARIDEDAYVAALLADLEAELAFAPATAVASIFIGGGTPSLFSAAAIGRLLDGIAARTTLVGNAEITLEANPGSAERARFAGYRAAGVNRLSLGIQSFDDSALAALGRVHDGAAARAAIVAARAAGFDNLNLDLMFGLPAVAPARALDCLDEALTHGPEHLSWYQLTLEEGTAFARRPPRLPDHDAICDVHDAGLARLAAHGYERYEVSAFATAGHGARHNLNYWHYGDYLGIGAGAHGKRTQGDTIVRRVKVRQPERYVKTARAGDAVAEQWYVAREERVGEYMINALRLRAGFALASVTARTGIAAHEASLATPLAAALARGWLTLDAGRAEPTELGYRYLNDLQALFIAPAGAPAVPA